MPAVPLSEDLRWRIVWATYDDRQSKKVIAARFIVSVSSVGRVRSIFYATGTVTSESEAPGHGRFPPDA